eukprot:374016-Prorocentrum_minimum.AAC.2
MTDKDHFDLDYTMGYCSHSVAIIQCIKLYYLSFEAIPSAPAAGSAWPQVAFTALSTRVPGTVPGVPGEEGASTAHAAPISMGSPRLVPVPCSSSAPTSPGAASAITSDERNTACRAKQPTLGHSSTRATLRGPVLGTGTT